MLKFEMEHFITTKVSAISKNHFNAWLPNSSINQLFAVCKPIILKANYKLSLSLMNQYVIPVISN